MKASNMIIGTLKEAPQEAVIDSHILLIRSGLVKKEVAGIYNFMPLGLKVLRKIENVIREEMDESGALEILCSALQPKEIWEESGRWQKYGPELMRLKDRNEREFCLGPTHEEVFTTLAKDFARSYKDLPKNVYQIQTKYRDEMRPRFGLIRSREFIMKDSYSFDKDEEGLDKSYNIMYDTYSRIFDRLHLDYVPVLADTGAIGGSSSHQFMALSDVGESTIIYNDNYAADQEKAETVAEDYNSSEAMKEIEEVSTPNVKTIEDLSAFLDVDKQRIVKALVYKNFTDNSLVVCFIRGDRELNKIKLANYLGVGEYDLDFALEDDFKKVNSVFGFVGPMGLNVRMIVDNEVPSIKNQIVGSNKMDAHLKNVNYERDYKGEVTDLRLAVEGDLDII
ncbi:MAG: proline--tRNA ligase, partial [Gammaproteobacteria bacterium]|nr:proline--tRNA ligase [Gammaproteobacteria bacterium]